MKRGLVLISELQLPRAPSIMAETSRFSATKYEILGVSNRASCSDPKFDPANVNFTPIRFGATSRMRT